MMMMIPVQICIAAIYVNKYSQYYYDMYAYIYIYIYYIVTHVYNCLAYVYIAYISLV